MVQRFAFTLIAILMAEACLAQSRPFAAWRVSPGDSNSARVEVWPDRENEKVFVWRLVSPGGALIAEMKQPVVPPGYTVNFGECKVNGALRQDVIAIVRHSGRREWSGDIFGFWFADAKARAFVKAQPEEVQCRNEGYGV